MTAQSYQNFIGIDIGKFEIVTAIHGSKQTSSFDNNLSGWKLLYKTLQAEIKNALIVLETTGGYELGLLLFLQKIKVKVHRANTRQVKNFIRSLGGFAKTDKLDAIALARYAFERHSSLKLFTASKEAFKLYEIAQRRLDLNKMLIQEKNRFQAPRCDDLIKESCAKMIALLTQEIKKIDQHLQALFEHDPHLTEQQKLLESIPGIGPITARALLCFMPELGTLNQKQVASLAGLAPHANESVTFKGMRRIKGGRQEVRNALFMAAMAARNSNSRFKAFYQNLVAKGKKPIVALTALMRKLIVVANAKLKELASSKFILET